MLIQVRLENGMLATQTLQMSSDLQPPPPTLPLCKFFHTATERTVAAESQCVPTHLDDLVSLRISSSGGGGGLVLTAHCSAMSPEYCPVKH